MLIHGAVCVGCVFISDATATTIWWTLIWALQIVWKFVSVNILKALEVEQKKNILDKCERTFIITIDPITRLIIFNSFEQNRGERRPFIINFNNHVKLWDYFIYCHSYNRTTFQFWLRKSSKGDKWQNEKLIIKLLHGMWLTSRAYQMRTSFHWVTVFYHTYTHTQCSISQMTCDAIQSVTLFLWLMQIL